MGKNHRVVVRGPIVTAVDTNILVYAHRSEMPGYSVASEAIRHLAEAPTPWAIPWPCLHEFFGVVTNPRLFATPTPVADAMIQIDYWLGSPTLVVLSEASSHWPTLGRLVRASSIRGAKIHDARIAAICLDHGVDEILTADRDFSSFPTLHTRNPLVRA